MAFLRVTRKGLVDCLAKSFAGPRKSSFDPYIVVSDTSAHNITKRQHFSSILLHRGEFLKVRVGDSLHNDSDRGEVEGAVAAMEAVENFENESGMKVRKAFHFADHPKVVGLFNGRGNMERKTEDYIKLVQNFQCYYGVYLLSSAKVHRKYNRIADYIARATRDMGNKDLTAAELEVLIERRAFDMKREDVNQEQTVKFEVGKKEPKRLYTLCTDRFGVPVLVMPND